MSSFDVRDPFWLCEGCDLGKVEDEEHLILACLNT
jgi:hypothetical protein